MKQFTLLFLCCHGSNALWFTCTGISTDFHTLDESLLDKLLVEIETAQTDVRLRRPPSWYLSLIAPNTKGPSKAWLDPSSMCVYLEFYQNLLYLWFMFLI